MKELERLAEFTAGLRYQDLPEEVKQAAYTCVMDLVPVTVGAWNSELLKRIRDTFQETVQGCERGISVWGTGGKMDLSHAVLLNGMAAHTLELDDVHTASKTHIGAVVIPAAWGLAEYLKKPVEDFLLSVVCGYEVMARIGMAFGVSGHRNRGWHATATAGTFGAAAACGSLLGLSPDEMAYALGLAGTQSFGVWAFLVGDANCKSLHAGRAAAAGMESALMAGAGLRGSKRILDAEDGGILSAMSDSSEISYVDAGLGTAWEILKIDRKPYPCCRSTHGPIDAALYLKEQYQIRPEEIDGIRVDTYLVGKKQCGVSEGSKNPGNAAQAKFSTPFTVACAFLSGSVRETFFTEEYMKRPEVRALLEKVRVEEDVSLTEQYPAHWGSRVTVTLKNGTVLCKQIRDASGGMDNPLSKQQLQQKAWEALTPVLGQDSGRIMQLLWELPSMDILPEL